MHVRRTLQQSSLIAACAVATWAGAAAAQSPSPEAVAPSPPVVAPTSSPMASPAPVDVRPEGTWLVTAYDAWGDGLVGPLSGSTLTVSLLPEGRLEGETGCGTYLGGYTVDGERISLGVISKGPDPCSRRRNDEAFAFSQALALTTTWASGPTGLELLDDEGLVRVALVRPGGEGLAGEWMMKRYTRPGGTLRPALEGNEPVITFGEDGELAGSTGCRIFEGRYDVETDRVIIAIDVVGLPCEGDERRQDRRVRAVLDAAVEWRRDEARVLLSDADGAPLAELVPIPMAPPASATEPPAESAAPLDTEG